MTTQYAARHVALGGDDSEPEGLASAWGDGPAPRRAMMPEEAVTSYEPYAPEPELLPFNVVQRMDPVAPQPPFAPELGLPVVAPLPSQTPVWHIAVEPSSPLAPGPIDAATPVTVGPLTDPASFPTPASNFAAVSYQSMPSPTPYASAPAQEPYVAPMASPYTAPMPEPYSAGDPTLENVMADLVVVAVDSDRLYPLRLSHEIAQASASSDPAHIISSLHGHDGFLIEIGQVGRIVRETLSRTRGR